MRPKSWNISTHNSINERGQNFATGSFLGILEIIFRGSKFNVAALTSQPIRFTSGAFTTRFRQSHRVQAAFCGSRAKSLPFSRTQLLGKSKLNVKKVLNKWQYPFIIISAKSAINALVSYQELSIILFRDFWGWVICIYEVLFSPWRNNQPTFICLKLYYYCAVLSDSCFKRLGIIKQWYWL